ncbi:unnamed protein product [Ceutorhynchus assimilis]|uniref:Caspase-3 n=1 Tax=Ceutorhynchus assimilis TaxID=467358 RepID=A0A9N9MFP8_9CUCU|nr:unnamed protein product [Ceutorhynchus assimilis]
MTSRFNLETDTKPFNTTSIKVHSPKEPTPRSPKKPIVKEVNKTTKDFPSFIEPQNFNLGVFEYERNGSNPGKVIIFNHEFYDDHNIKVRRGSRRDVNEILTCFQRLGFNIHEGDLLLDSTVAEIQQKIKNVLEDKASLREANCLIIIFLTHGHNNDELHARDGTFKCSEVWTKFNKCAELKHKPKMFIFQACKGDYYTTVDGADSFVFKEDSAKLVNIESFIVNELDADMLLLYSTIEGNVSFRHPSAGTWFIQELCKNFSAYGRRDDVISLVTRTIKCVSGYYNFDEDVSEDLQKQMPIFVSTLSRKFYLNRNKDRHLLLEIMRKQEEIYNMVKDINRKIKN